MAHTRMITIIGCFMFIWIFQADDLAAQQEMVYFQQISREEMLSQSTVNAILKDKTGFLWLGTEDGLNLYDGYQIKVYKHVPGKENSISNSAIWSIFEDNSETLWIGTFNGLNRYNRDADSFDTFLADPDSPGSLSDNYVRAIVEDNDGHLWVGTNMGLNRFDASSQSFITYIDQPEKGYDPNSNVINTMIVDHLGKIWIGTNDGLRVYNDMKDSFITYDLPSQFPRNRITTLHEDNDGVLWVGTESYGLFTFDRRSSSFIPFQLEATVGDSDLRINSISGSIFDIIWVGTNQGIYRISDHGSRINAYQNDYFNEHSISDSEVRSLFSEDNGFVWIGTINGGINLINPAKSRFGHVATLSSGFQHNKGKVVRAIHEDENSNLVIGTMEGGIGIYDTQTGKTKEFTGRIGKLLEGSIITSLVIEDGEYWFGSRTNGLIRYNIRNGNIKQYLDKNKDAGNISGNNIISLIKDRTGILWIGTNGDGLYEFNPLLETFVQHKHNPENNSSISNNRIYAIKEDKKGEIWIGTAGGGLNVFNKQTHEFRSFNNDPSDPDGHEFNYILCIHEDAMGDIWAGTFGNGLIRYDTNDSLHFYNEQTGLPNNVIYGLLEDDHGKLWLSHNQGITKFNPENDSACLNFDVRDGLQGNEFNSNAAYKCRNGKLVFGGINGFNVFHPDSIHPNNNIPPVVFTNFKISNIEVPIGKLKDGRTILSHSITHASEVNLLHSDREIFIEFAALDYAVSSKNRYRYKLVGRDNEWIELGTTNQVTFYDLPSGKSTLHVIGSNSDGKWNETGAKLTINVKPPFYKTALFYGFVLFVFFGILLLYYYMRMKNLRSQKRELEMLIQSKTKELGRQRDILELKNDELESKNQMEREQAEKTAEMAERLQQANQSKLQFFTNISHEFRTPLTLILGFIEKLQNTTTDYRENERNEDYRMIEKNANKLLKLINRLMQFRKLTTHQVSLKVSENNLVDFIRNQASLYKNLADKKDISFSFESYEESVMTWFDHEQMEEVITNLLSNAFKYSPNNSAIRVSVGRGGDQQFSYTVDEQPENPEQYVYFSVEDNGIGIPIDKQKLVFKRFYQVTSGKEADNKGAGTGIGLHIADVIIKMHDGLIFLKSAPGEGTIFTVALRIGKSHLSDCEFIDQQTKQTQNIIVEEEETLTDEIQDKTPPINTTIEQLSKKDLPKILVLEDNPELRRFIVKGLNAAYRVIEAENGSQAIKLLEEEDPEVIISDVLLPGKMNGFDFAERCKSNLSTSHIPIIMLTALDSVDQKVLGLEKGADIYMTKPFSLRELQAHIQSIIQSRLTLKKKFREQAFYHGRELEITDKDETFLQKTIRIIEAGMSDPNFNVSYLCDAMNMSQTKLYRKVKALTDMTITDFIRGLRLRKASGLMIETDKNVSEIAYEVGFNDPNYFGKCFKAQFGQSPSEFIKEQKTS